MPSVAARFEKQLHTPPEADKSLPIPFAKVGIEIEVENCNYPISRLQREFPNWQLHTEEHSLRDRGMEFVTPGGMIGTQILSAVKGFCAKAKELNFSEGYPRAGIHLHIDVTDMNEKSDTEMLNMVLAYMLFEHVFFAYAGEWRRACGFCDALLASQHDFPAISKLLYGWRNYDRNEMDENAFSKYAALNFLPLNRFGTLEIRHLPTTFDVDRISDWIKLSLCLKRFGMSVDEDPVEMLMKHGPEALINIVFKGHVKLAKKYVETDKLWQAVPEIMALRIMRKRGKLDPWADPDNPLLAMKRVAKPKAKKESPEIALSAAQLYSMYTEALNSGNGERASTLANQYLAARRAEAAQAAVVPRNATLGRSFYFDSVAVMTTSSTEPN